MRSGWSAGNSMRRGAEYECGDLVRSFFMRKMSETRHRHELSVPYEAAHAMRLRWRHHAIVAARHQDPGVGSTSALIIRTAIVADQGAVVGGRDPVYQIVPSQTSFDRTAVVDRDPRRAISDAAGIYDLAAASGHDSARRARFLIRNHEAICDRALTAGVNPNAAIEISGAVHNRGPAACNDRIRDIGGACAIIYRAAESGLESRPMSAVKDA